MRVNFFEGFKNRIGDILNINPKDVSEDYLDNFILPNPIIRTSDGNKHKLQGNIMFKVIRRSPDAVTIKDISYSDPKNKNLSDFPHGINASADAGKEYTISGVDFRSLLKWSLPPSAPPGGGLGPGGPGGPGGGLGI